jgi:hypothetical protein
LTQLALLWIGLTRAESETSRRCWQPKLLGSVPGAFEIDVLMPEVEGVLLNYRSYDGKAVRTRFRFTAAGKILRTACAPIQNDGPGSLAS